MASTVMEIIYRVEKSDDLTKGVYMITKERVYDNGIRRRDFDFAEYFDNEMSADAQCSFLNMVDG